MKLPNACSKLVALLENALSLIINECVEFQSKIRHALSKIVKFEVHHGQLSQWVVGV